MQDKVNAFLSQLLALQQDGSGAVSAPTNWSKTPLLYVETALDQAVNTLAEEIAANSGATGIGRWQFFVGSPGNGKSAAVGRLSQALLAKGFKVCDQEGTSLDQLPADRPPYVLSVFEPGKRYPRAWIAQDASVLPDPYKPNPSPADELVLLMEEAAARGLSLVVCTNRGVLERAYAQTYLNAEYRSAPWFRALQVALKQEAEQEIDLSRQPATRRVYARVRVRSIALDRRSLLLKSTTMDELVKKAVDDVNWRTCQECASAPCCPFFQNRNWLANSPLRREFIRTLKRAEVLSGHVIVFREAVALISTILAGSPADIDADSPCTWVHAKRSAGSLFALVARRIYMVLYSGHSPAGLERNRQLRRGQTESLKGLVPALRHEEQATCRRALERALKDAPQLSTDLGVTRLLAADGVFHELDIFNEPVPDLFEDEWALDLRRYSESSPLEGECARIWDGLKEAAANSPLADGTTHAWISRWISAATLRCGALQCGQTAFAPELDELVGILEGAQVRRTELVSTLTAALGIEEQGAEISQFASIKGHWVTANLTPNVDTGPRAQSEPDNIALVVKIGDFTFLISSRAFIWLKRRHNWKMELQSFPSGVLQTARDTLVAAATSSNYDLQPNGVRISVRKTDGQVVSIARFGDEVEIDGL